MSKITKFAIAMLLLAVIILSFGAGYKLGGGVPSSSLTGLDVVEQAWNILFNDYVDKSKLDADKMSQAAIEGMIETLDDPYTSYLDKQNYRLGLSSLEGEFDGIGAHIAVKDKQLTIIAPIPDSPADKAGIKAGDVVLEVNGQPTSEMSLAEAVLNIRGRSGTAVRLLILHEGATEPVVIEIVRARIELTSVRFEMKEDIAYINITQFSENTGKELSPVLEGIIGGKATGIVLDLRSNPGGLLDVVVEIASHFLREGVVVNVVSDNETVSTLKVNSGALVTDLPMVVLVDSFSASGSEVLSGALQDYGRATIAGTQTFGKGSVNVLRQLKDGSGLYVTTARWLTPKGRLIEGKGITPDYELVETGEEAIRWAMDYLKSKG